MEDLLEKLTTSTVTAEQAFQNEYNDLFKTLSVAAGQEKRRKLILQRQRKERNDALDETRGILEIVERVEQGMEVDSARAYKPSAYVPGFQNKPLTYANTLMLSEWLVEKPEDFAKKWQLVPCPKGTRVLVVSVRSTTKCYTKHGHLLKQWQTLLPGGSRGGTGRSQCCVIDCIYNEACETLYILDFLAWGNLPMMDCESEFRNFWLQAQFSENPGLIEKTVTNEVKFSLLPRYDCQKEQLDNFFSRYPAFPDNQPPVDGLLFYHRQSPYLAGETPLVGWLYPYMVNEVLGQDITVHENYLHGKPRNYINQSQFITDFNEVKSKKDKKGQKYYRKSPGHKRSKKSVIGAVSSVEPESGVSGFESMDPDDEAPCPIDSYDSEKYPDSLGIFTAVNDMCD